MNISEHIYRLHHNVHRTEQRSATLLHARIFTERRKQAAVKALVLLLQSIDLGRVHVSCAPFSESKATLGNSARRLMRRNRRPHVIQACGGNGNVALARRHLSKSWPSTMDSSTTPSQFVAVGGLAGRRWRRPLAALSPLSGLMNIAETYILTSE